MTIRATKKIADVEVDLTIELNDDMTAMMTFTIGGGKPRTFVFSGDGHAKSFLAEFTRRAQDDPSRHPDKLLDDTRNVFFLAMELKP